ncbi:putative ATPase [Labedaea rhizosphaerae]|uniref:Putative ATPase n=2 Tax=Labedaea rhizosphaerae TaxID=598644 RepID=A0A4V3D079_LABRH|nr:putative ATPase [Labedaea rhizosphaerae]
MLGPLRVSAADGATVELGGARLRMLLARLALDAGQVVQTEALIDGLWGEQPPADATNALQSLVSRLRRGLRTSGNGDVSVLESHPAGYRLLVDREDVDTHRFEQLARQGRDELLAGEPANAAETLTTALGLWRGAPLADIGDAPFTDPVRSRLTELRIAAHEDRIEAELKRGRHHEVIAELGALTREHPLRERAAGLHVVALYQSGRQADALAAYEATRRALDTELGVEPSAELRDIHLRVLRRDPDLAPPEPQQAKVRAPRLPAPLTTFVGRDEELDEILSALGYSRLVTLLGPGGAGKTRLATEVAARQRVDSAVVFVELAGVGDGADIVAAILTALGLHEVVMLENRPAHIRQVDPLDRLVDALSARETLLVLDNCEHLIAAAANLCGDLLARCAPLRVLATSREPLAITGEALVPVGPLELPEPGATLDQIRESAAVRLFCDRAAAVRPGFALDESSGLITGEVCRKLDGLPLALELAAARLRAMTLTQIADRLDDRFRLLTGGSRTSLPRHRTLRAVVEWSWDLLEKPELVLARRLSVFPAGATLETATAVCADNELPADDVLYVLASLVEKSLVEAGEGRDGQPRYRMLETVRAFAEERLTEAGERERVQRAFSRALRDLVERAEPHLRGADQIHWLGRLYTEQDNIIAAVRHAVDNDDADTAVRITVSSGWYWMVTGRHGEVGALAKRALELTGPAPADGRAILRAFDAFGEFAGTPAREEIAGLREELHKTDAMARFPMLAMLEPLLAAFTGDIEAAEEGLRRGESHPDPWARAAAELGRSFLAENEGHAAEAEERAQKALERFTELGDRWGQAMALRQLSERHSLRGEMAVALAQHEEAVRLTLQLGTSEELAEQRGRLAMQRLRAGDLDGAERGLLETLDSASGRGSADLQAVLYCGLAALHRIRGDLTAAHDYLQRGIELFKNIPSGMAEGHGIAMWSGEAGALAIAEGDADAATKAYARAMAAMNAMPDMPVIASLGEGFAEVLWLRDDPQGAARCIGWATAIRGTPDLGNRQLNKFKRRLKERLGEEEFEAALREGEGIGRDAALAALVAEMGLPKENGPSPVW